MIFDPKQCLNLKGLFKTEDITDEKIDRKSLERWLDDEVNQNYVKRLFNTNDS